MWILIERLRKFKWLVVVLAAIAFWMFVYRNLPYSSPLAWGDFPLYPIQGAVTLANRVIYAWQPVGLGFSEYTFPGRLAISLLVALLGNDSLLAHNVYYLALLPIASLAFYLCTARAIKSDMARAIAALLYVMNPAVIGQFAGGSPELLFSYALIPVAAFCFEKLGGERGKNLAIWVLASGVVIAAGFSFYLSFMLVSIPLLVLPLIASVNHSIKALIRLPGLIFLSYALALLLTITLSFPLIQSALGSTTDTLVALRPGNAAWGVVLIALLFKPVRVLFGRIPSAAARRK